jgi:ABC-type dipeptide/oligopeptide/nickel transport system permease component
MPIVHRESASALRLLISGVVLTETVFNIPRASGPLSPSTPC